MRKLSTLIPFLLAAFAWVAPALAGNVWYVHSANAGGGSEAQLFMPDLGNSVDFERELQIGTATNANALIERGT